MASIDRQIALRRALRSGARAATTVLLVVVLALVVAVALRAVGANPEATFTDWAYGARDVLIGPFDGTFDSAELRGDGVLDTSALLAAAVYVAGAVAFAFAGQAQSYRLADLRRTQKELEDRAATERLLGNFSDRARQTSDPDQT